MMNESSSAPCAIGSGIDNLLDRGNPPAMDLLQALLSAERAGVRIARETSADAAVAQSNKLVEQVHRDELRYCQMLMTQLRRAGQEPNTETGDFYGKCMAIEDIGERLTFLNRGQGWVVRKIESILPEILDVELSAALAEMLDTHRENIRQTEELVGQGE